MRRALALALASVVLLAAAQPAAADGRHRRHGHHHHHRHHHHHGSGVFLGLNFGIPVNPRYHAPPVVVYQAPPPVIYRAPPIAQAPPAAIALGREVGQGCREYTSPVIVGGRTVEGYGIT
jgi:hypothetical protein